MLAVAQLRVQVLEAPALSADPHNPRNAPDYANWGNIVAHDGTVLATSRDGRRYYPYGAMFAHAIGYAGVRTGSAGLEDAYAGVLAPRRVELDPLLQLRSAFDPALRAPPHGATVVTTLDVPVQTALYDALVRYPRAAGIVLDPRTGAVLAMASVPSFDPNALARTFTALTHDARSPLLDRSTSGLYPPGSTFKIFTAAAALDAGAVTAASTFSDPGYLQVGTFTIHNDESEVTGTQDLAGAFALSSNVDFAQIALKLGKARFYDYLDRWRIGQSLQFDIPAARDHVPSPADVSDSILAQMGFGQGALLMTPLQMALLGATIAARGVEPRPYLVRSIDGPQTHLTTSSEQLATPISPETADTVRTLMIAVVKRGTGTAAALAGVTVAGKTGTATNPQGKAHAWFVAFAPAESPKVALAVVVENAGYGGAISAPIAATVLRVALSRTE